ncbi:MAG: UbiD family decarboxylase [Phycisphaerales bacterium]|nr:UbiD family decarboxylase [Phycisphaerales bacterium]
MYADLHHFVDALTQSGELIRIKDSVDPVLEITQYADTESKMAASTLGSPSSQRNDPEFARLGGKALLFENPLGSDFPVLINAFGSYRRMEMALGNRAFDDIAQTIGELVKPEPPRLISEAISKAKQFFPLLKIGPKRSNKPGICQQVVHTAEDIDLTKLPMLRCWPLDGDFEAVGYPAGINDGIAGMGHPDIDDATWNAKYRGRFITLAGIHTIHADDRNDPKPKSHNIGMYRLQLLAKNRLAMHWHMHHDGAAHWRSWKKLGQPMPVAIALGGASVLPYAATCPLPPGISELLMAGFLNGKGIPLCRAQTVPLWVPSDAEMIIEGFVRTDAGFPGWDPRQEDEGEFGDGAVFEGPFGDHTGFYSMPDRYPIVEVSAFTHRKDAIYPTTVVGLPPQEDYFLGKATERIMKPLLQTILPDIKDYHLPMYGAFHNVANIQISKHYPLHARTVMHGIWGAGQMAWTKNLFIVDDTVDVHDLSAVLTAVYQHCKPSRDIEQVNGALDILDHAAPRLGSGIKLGFDATKKIVGEEIDGHQIAAPSSIPSSKQRSEAVAFAQSMTGVLDASAPEQAPGWLFIKADKDHNEPDRAKLGASILEAYLAESSAMKFIVVLGRSVDIHDHHSALFHWAANFDASRDAQWDQSQGCDRVGFDATPKTPEDTRNNQPVRAWPPVLSFD